MKHNELIQVKTTKNIVNDACEIINTAQYSTHYAINIALVWRNWLLSMAKALTRLIFIAFIRSINCIQTFSTQCVENLLRYYLGHVIGY